MLTPEQEERIRVNRERAMAIQRQKREKLEKEENDKKRKQEKGQELNSKRQKGDEKEEEEESVILEEFEEGASEYVTKKEAMKMYCLPEGTLAVCECVEKANPHNKGWAPMKMYRRSEMRRRSRKRFEGLDGLIAERKAREEKRFAKDIEKANEIFKS